MRIEDRYTLQLYLVRRTDSITIPNANEPIISEKNLTYDVARRHLRKYRSTLFPTAFVTPGPDLGPFNNFLTATIIFHLQPGIERVLIVDFRLEP